MILLDRIQNTEISIVDILFYFGLRSTNLNTLYMILLKQHL